MHHITSNLPRRYRVLWRRLQRQAQRQLTELRAAHARDPKNFPAAHIEQLILTLPAMENLPKLDLAATYTHSADSVPVTLEFLQLCDQAPPSTCLGQVLLCFLGAASGRMRSNSAQTYVMALVRILLDIICHQAGIPPRRFRGRIDAAALAFVMALPASILTLDRARDFKRLAYAAYQHNPGKLRGARNRLSNAQNIFNSRRRLQYAKYGLRLPDGLVGFAQAVPLQTSLPEHTSLQAKDWRILLRDLEKLARTDPDCFIFIVLLLFAGLRAQEAMVARIWWVVTTRCEPCLRVQLEWDFVPKDGEARDAVLMPEIAHLLLSRKATEYLVAPTKAGRKQARKRAMAWMRAHGADPSRPCHAMRHHYLSALLRLFGRRIAQNSAGHSKGDTTLNWYALSQFTAAMAEQWRRWGQRFRGRLPPLPYEVQARLRI
jgi:hypothetical protein